MSLKPLQTAKRVGIKWRPNAEMSSRFVEPLLEKRYFDMIRREGRAVLHSVAINDYNGMHVGQTAQFDERIRSMWQRGDLVQAQIDKVERTYIEQVNSYRMKYHLQTPDAERQRNLVGRSTLEADSILSVEDQARYRDIQESVFFDVPARLLPVPAGDAEAFLEDRIMVMRQQLGDQAIRSECWLSSPQMYVVTYQPHESTKLAALLERNRSKHLQN